MRELHKADHPLWRFANMLVLLVIIWIFSYTSASNFDETEYKMITKVMLAMFGWDFLQNKLRDKAAKE